MRMPISVPVLCVVSRLIEPMLLLPVPVLCVMVVGRKRLLSTSPRRPHLLCLLPLLVPMLELVLVLALCTHKLLLVLEQWKKKQHHHSCFVHIKRYAFAEGKQSACHTRRNHV